MVCETRNSLFAGSCACAGERALNGWDSDHSPQIATEQRAGLPIAIGGFCPFRVESERGSVHANPAEFLCVLTQVSGLKSNFSNVRPSVAIAVPGEISIQPVSSSSSGSENTTMPSS